MRFRLPMAVIGHALVAQALFASSTWGAEPVDYESQIKPLLATKCVACHGALRQEAGLRLDASSLIAKGSDDGPVVIPNKAGESALMVRVSAADELQMPPEGEGERLTSEQLALLRDWINQGAIAPEESIPPDPRAHWAYQPPLSSRVPSVNRIQWSSNPIDAFIAAQHEAAGLIPAAPAARETLLRRVYFDLIGLPPSRAELHAFLHDNSPQAYERVVDRLLASPLYGERWGRHWMDVWRYSDWSGFGNEIRYSQPHIWRWRDWIMESLNADRGYDRMLLEMLAADELAPHDPQAARATGFLVRNWYKFDRNTWLDETVEHTAKAFLGLTINCCRCHDHKYDPLTQREFYQLRAVFEPYDVRADALPDGPDPTASLARAYDGKPDSPTYLFIRGDAKRPDKGHPVTAGVPAVVGGSFNVDPVALPFESYYPALRREVLAQQLAQAQADIASAEQALDKLQRAPNYPPTANEQNATSKAATIEAGELELAELHLKSVQAMHSALQARIHAEALKHSAVHLLPNEMDVSPDLSLEEAIAAAASQSRAAAIATAEESLQNARNILARAKQDEKSQDAQAELAIKTATQKVEAAEIAFATAQQATEKGGKSYEPLGPSYPQSSTGRRLALARWITDRTNPLTARVAVNHIWQRHFGAPLVENVVDFGLRSPRPQQAKLLDFLAVQLMENNWKMKPLHRMIVLSQAYQMSSAVQSAPPENLQIDRDNKRLWRMNSRRLEAEAVRDSLLYVSGRLDLSQGGPDLDHKQGLSVPRRSVYFRHAREKQMEFLMMFDAASPTECYRRETSIRPQQAFALMNSSLAITQARRLAKMLGEPAAENASGDERGFILQAFETVLSRTPTAEEVSACQEFLNEQATRLASPQGLAVIGRDDTEVAPSSNPQQRARENLVLVLFNHNDFVTVR